MTNPLLSTAALPDFAAIRPEHVRPAITELLAAAQAALDEAVKAETPADYDTLSRILDTATERLGTAWGAVGHLNAVADTPALREAYNGMLPVTVKRAFGRPTGADNDYCLKVGLKRHSTEQVVNRYLQEMMGFMKECGLKFPQFSAFEKVGAELMPSTRKILASNQ